MLVLLLKYWKVIAGIVLVIMLILLGAWIDNKIHQAKELAVVKQENKEMIVQQQKQQEKTIVLNKQKQAFTAKSDAIDRKAYEETNKHEYSDTPIPDSGRLLINDAINEANGYSNTSK